MKILIFAEKKDAGKLIAKALGISGEQKGYIEDSQYVVTWSNGHLFETATPEQFLKWEMDSLPFIPDKLNLKVSKGREPQYKIIKELFNRQDINEIINAGDAGREGELIFRECYYLTACKKPVKRCWTASLTEPGIKKAMSSLLDSKLYDNLYLSAKARQDADWIVGVNATRILTLKGAGKGVLSMGRVQAPLLSIISKRYLDNIRFKPEKYYEISSLFSKTDGGFDAKGVESYSDHQEALKTLGSLGDQGKVVDFEKKEKLEMPPLPYDLASLQIDASNNFGFGMSKTLEIAQSLYENQAITYPRTSSQYLTKDMAPQLKNVLARMANFYPGLKPHLDEVSQRELHPHIFNEKKIADHHAIIPTGKAFPLEQLTEEERKVFGLVVLRFVVSFSQPCRKEITSVLIENNQIKFKKTGTVIAFEGWRAVSLFPGQKIELEEEKEEVIKLPALEKNDVLKSTDHKLLECYTRPKGLFRESDITALMKNIGPFLEDKNLRVILKDKGIGTPATRHSILEKLFERKYIEKQKNGTIIPTPLGLSVYEIILENDLAKPELTANWEQQLEFISDGKYKIQDFLEGIRVFTIGFVTELKNMDVQHILEKNSTLECPVCREKLTEQKYSFHCKNGHFKLSRSIAGKEIPAAQIQKLLEKGITDTITGFNSKSGEKFSAKLKLDGEHKVVFSFEGIKKKGKRGKKAGAA